MTPGASLYSIHCPVRRRIGSILRGLAAWIFLWQGAGSAALGQAAAPLRHGEPLDLVVSTSLFRSVNRNDAVPALRTWASLVGQKRGIRFQPTVQIFHDAPEIRKHLLSGASGVMALDAQEFLLLSDLKSVEPMFSLDRGTGEISSRYVLIIRDEPAATSLQSLRNKSLLIYASTGANLGLVWLQSLLAGAHLQPAESFFSSVEVASKPSAALLPVFFNRADAAVVDEASFDVSKEMNPQLGRKLRVLSASPLLVEAVVCLFGTRFLFRDELIASIRDLHLDVQGQQILTTLRFSRMAPLNAAALERSVELLRRQGGLAAHSKPMPGGGGTAPDNLAITRGRSR